MISLRSTIYIERVDIYLLQVQVVFPTLVTGSMEEYVTNANQFFPKRWMKDCPELHKIHPFASLPYGYGARMCLGRRFADLEIQVLLSKVLILFLSIKTQISKYVTRLLFSERRKQNSQVILLDL